MPTARVYPWAPHQIHSRSSLTFPSHPARPPQGAVISTPSPAHPNISPPTAQGASPPCTAASRSPFGSPLPPPHPAARVHHEPPEMVQPWFRSGVSRSWPAARGSHLAHAHHGVRRCYSSDRARLVFYGQELKLKAAEGVRSADSAPAFALLHPRHIRDEAPEPRKMKA